ncbi:MAG: alkaline phosphatase [bacterium]
MRGSSECLNWQVSRILGGMAAVLFLFVVAIPPPSALANRATNVVLFIGDGMGFEHVKAARYYKGAPLCFETWPSTGSVDTASASSPTPSDSAAGATAIATGCRVSNSVISTSIPGNSKALTTVLEYLKAKGKRTGLVTTDFMSEATPAAFGAHTENRYNSDAITNDYLTGSRPNILYGGGGMTAKAASNAGYRVVTTLAGMQAIDTATATNISGQFSTGRLPYELGETWTTEPHIWQMTSNAIEVLRHGQSGFFLMVEGANIDEASHFSQTGAMIHEVLAFENAVRTAQEWALERGDTLIVVTADHETGGLVVTSDNGISNTPGVSWTSPGTHTSTNVGIWAWGAGAGYAGGQTANTNTHMAMLNSTLLKSTCAGAFTTATNPATIWQAVSGDVYRVESAAQLCTPAWSPVCVVTASATSITIADTNAVPFTSRFYRIISLP